MDAAAAAAAAVSSLRTRPTSLRVTLASGDVRTVAVPEVKRWKQRVADVLASLSWISFESLDAKGQLLAAPCENQGAEQAGDLEDLVDASATTAQVGGLLSLMLKGQDVALSRQARAYESVLANNAKLLEVISARLMAMEKQRHDDMVHLAELYQRVGQAGDSGGDDAMALELVKALGPALVKK